MTDNKLLLSIVLIVFGYAILSCMIASVIGLKKLIIMILEMMKKVRGEKK